MLSAILAILKAVAVFALVGVASAFLVKLIVYIAENWGD